MTQFRRSSLTKIQQPPIETHAGLWLDKFFAGDDAQDAKTGHVNQVTAIPASDAYKTFFKRWNHTLTTLGADCRAFRTDGRLVVNLGAECVLETSIALHRTYGTPYIPGSALKGLAAHYVATYFKDDPAWDEETKRILFGNTVSAGYVTFYDALYVPDTGKGLLPDVITVHHPEYYQGTKPAYSKILELAPPADWDSPTPIPFITVNGTFLIALAGPSPAWVQTAFEVLEEALKREGVGAKTSSGYGRMKLDTGGVKERIVDSYSAIPELGDVFAGTIFATETDRLELFIPGLDDTVAYAVILLDKPGKDKEDDTVRCKVIGFEAAAGGATKVICEKFKKSKKKSS